MWPHDEIPGNPAQTHQIHSLELTAPIAKGRKTLHVEHFVPRALLEVELLKIVALLPNLRRLAQDFA